MGYESIDNVVSAFMHFLKFKDEQTYNHSVRVGRIACLYSESSGAPEPDAQAVSRAGFLHDIGKITFNYSLFDKRINVILPEEIDKIKQHPVISEKICSNISLLSPILPIIRHHHERYDGNGYPDNLKGDDIPYPARILAIVDSFDAIMYRPYNGGLKELEFTLAKMDVESNAGAQWDKGILKDFFKFARANKGKIKEIFHGLK